MIKTLCLLGNFSCFFLSSAFFFKINFLKKFFQEYHSQVWIHTRPGVFGPDLIPNCLQRLSVDDTCRQLLRKTFFRPPEKSAKLKIIFLISQPKHNLWVLKRTV